MKVLTPSVSVKVRKTLRWLKRGVDGRAGAEITSGLEDLGRLRVQLGKGAGSGLLEILETMAKLGQAGACMASLRAKLVKVLGSGAGGGSPPLGLSDVESALAMVDGALTASLDELGEMVGVPAKRLQFLHYRAVAEVERCLGSGLRHNRPSDEALALALPALELGTVPDPNYKAREDLR